MNAVEATQLRWTGKDAQRDHACSSKAFPLLPLDSHRNILIMLTTDVFCPLLSNLLSSLKIARIEKRLKWDY